MLFAAEEKDGIVQCNLRLLVWKYYSLHPLIALGGGGKGASRQRRTFFRDIFLSFKSNFQDDLLLPFAWLTDLVILLHEINFALTHLHWVRW
jgi:hypothetical protein